jgi:hypothetical protein
MSTGKSTGYLQGMSENAVKPTGCYSFWDSFNQKALKKRQKTDTKLRQNRLVCGRGVWEQNARAARGRRA